MTRLAVALEAALDAVTLAEALARPIESTLGGPEAVAGAFVFATTASGALGEEVGERLAARWVGAELVGTSFEGIVGEGRVWQGEPAIGVLAWSAGAGAPVPIVCEGGERDPDDLVKEILGASAPGEAEARGAHGSFPLVVLFPDALATPGLPDLLSRFGPVRGGPWLAGAAAVGPEGEPARSWARTESPAPDRPLVGLLFPGRPPGPRSAAAAAPPDPIRCASATRPASPWLEITACRPHWVDALDGEPPVDWIRRQLGLADGAAIEPYLDRLLVRVARGQRGGQHGGHAADDSADSAEPPTFEERYVTGLDPRRGALGLVGGFARFDRLAFALPDAMAARERLREAVADLPPTPVVLQLGCPGRGEALHGDRDIESAIVADQAGGRRTLGVLAPFQLASDPTGSGRLLVHATVLAAIGGLDESADSD